MSACLLAFALAVGAAETAPPVVPGLEDRPAEGPALKPPAAPAPAPGAVEHRAPRYAFTVPPGWRGPEPVAGGERFVEPKGRAFIELLFHESGSREWKPPAELRRDMERLGATEDAHRLDVVQVAGRYASRARYSSYFYEGDRIGERSNAFYTELIMAPDPLGVYLVRYRAVRGDFLRLWKDYLLVLSTLSLSERVPKPERYYLDRRGELKQALEARPWLDLSEHQPSYLARDRQFYGGLALGLPAGGEFQLNYLLDSREKPVSVGLYYGGLAVNFGGSEVLGMTSLGARVRWHFRRPGNESGPLLFGDLAHHTARFGKVCASCVEVPTEKKTRALQPSAGFGYQIFRDRFAADFLLGAGPKKKLFQRADVLSPAPGSSEVSLTLFLFFHIGAGVRF